MSEADIKRLHAEIVARESAVVKMINNFKPSPPVVGAKPQ